LHLSVQMCRYTVAVAGGFKHRAPSGPLPDHEANTLAEAMSAFATPSRLKLLYALLGVERTVEELAASTFLNPNVVSQQLRVLRLLRLAAARRDGRYIRYRLFDHHVADLLAAIRYHGEHASGKGLPGHAVKATPNAG
jgi:DNA-binding transcriptional ArsR family regulator